jgi:hypothetical protein
MLYPIELEVLMNIKIPPNKGTALTTKIGIINQKHSRISKMREEGKKDTNNITKTFV